MRCKLCKFDSLERRALSCQPTWSRFDSCVCIKLLALIRQISPPPFPFNPSTPPHQLLQPLMQYFIPHFNSNATSPNSHTLPYAPTYTRGLGPNQTSQVDLAIIAQSEESVMDIQKKDRILVMGALAQSNVQSIANMEEQLLHVKDVRDGDG